MIKKIFLIASIFTMTLTYFSCENVYSNDETTNQTSVSADDPGSRDYEDWDPEW
ncbi:MAG: hypothetical protein PQJ60_08855 [Spirochaetales bacterium]|nr:hypothetical protein [Spirochaetales bacterium]